MITRDKYFIEIDLNRSIRATIIDLNISGLGFEVVEIDPKYIEVILNSDKLFIKIYLAESVLFVEVRKVWNAVIEDKGNKTLKGGMTISVISAEDKIKLSNFIEEFRNRV